MQQASTIAANKAVLRSLLTALRYPNAQSARDSALGFYARDTAIHVVHPFNTLVGGQEYIEKVLQPLSQAFAGLGRADYIAFAGSYEGADWVTSAGYYHGQFVKPWLGIRPTGDLGFLRFGEFHRMEGGQAVESYIYFDIPELMIAADVWPIAESPGLTRGYTGYLPGPASGDGLQWQENDPARSSESCALVTEMLRELATPDATWRPYWHENMRWYGPAAFGSFAGLEQFTDFQVPFENTFSEWIGGSVEGSETRHFTRFGDGDYICSGGWPSLNAVQAKPFLGCPSNDKRLYMRVCDWWRRDGDKLVENWVFVDIPHVLLQMGRDVFSELNEVQT